jgi:hypothetical protein
MFQDIEVCFITMGECSSDSYIQLIENLGLQTHVRHIPKSYNPFEHVINNIHTDLCLVLTDKIKVQSDSQKRLQKFINDINTISFEWNIINLSYPKSWEIGHFDGVFRGAIRPLFTDAFIIKKNNCKELTGIIQSDMDTITEKGLSLQFIRYYKNFNGLIIDPPLFQVREQ